MKKLLLIVSLLIINIQLFAQINITGQVTDKTTGDPVPGATIAIEGTTKGTITNFDGLYNIEVESESDVLLYSFIGYTTQKVTVGTQTTINVILTEDVENLEEVVVTALGIKREKKALGYAVQDVKGDDITKGGDANVVSALSGKIAGVQITSASGSVGGSAVIKIRGNKSFRGGTSPLFVVDGVPISNSTSTTDVDYGNASADIDPENIESMSVLKGAAATALYGSRGANGVVLITTKKGTKAKGLGVTVSSSVAFDNVYILPNYQNEYGQGGNNSYSNSLSEYYWKQNNPDWADPGYSGQTYQEWAAAGWAWSPDNRDDASWGARLDDEVYTVQFDSPLDADGNRTPTEMISRPDNIKNFYETGVSTVNSVALSGGNETALGRLIITHTDQKGTTPNTDQEKLNIGFSSEVKLSDRLKFSVNGNYNVTKNDNLSYQGRSTKNPLYEFNNWFGRQVDVEYLKDHYTETVVHQGNSDFSEGDISLLNWMTGYKQYNNNIYWTLNENLNSRKRNRIFGSISSTYTIANGFDLLVRVGTDEIFESRKSIMKSGTKGTLWEQQNPLNGSFRESLFKENETNADLMLNINKNINEDITLVSVLGANYRRNTWQSIGFGVANLVIPNFFSTEVMDGKGDVSKSLSEKETNSLFGSANLGYKNYLYLDLTYRHDWSSTLPPDSRDYGYYSSTLGFIFSDAFDIKSRTFTYGKIRASYAEVGNDTSPFGTQLYYYRYGSVWSGAGGDANFFRLGSTLPSENLQPERTSSYEFGGEFKFLNNRLGLDITYYHATTEDQLMNVRQAPSNGFYNWKKNAGRMLNTGTEIQFYATPVKTNNFSWDIQLNFSKNKNEIVELDGEISELEINTFKSAKDAQPVTLWARVGKEWGTFEGYSRKRDEETGKFLIGSDGKYILTDEPVELGSVNPDFLGGIRNSFTYKRFSLSALIDFKMGGKIYSSSKVQGQHTGLLEATVKDNQREEGLIADGIYADGVTDSDGNSIAGQQNTTRISSYDYWYDHSRGFADMALIDASYVKFREINFAYNLPKSFLSKLKLQSATVSFFGRNIALLYTDDSNDVGIDPEVAASGSVLDTGFENFNLAPSRTLGFKLNVNF